MQKDGKNCRLIQTDVYSDEVKTVLETFQPSDIVFPVLQMKDSFPVDLLKVDARLYTGQATDEWVAPFKESGIHIQSYLSETVYIWENAKITAEAFVKVFYEETGQMIYGKKFTIAGFGRVGKMTAYLLRGMGARITIMTGDEAERIEAQLSDFHAYSIYEQLPGEDDYLVNTIPAKWLKVDCVKPIFIFDLASSPGCLDGAGNLEYYKLLPGLPGKHFPSEAAKALTEALYRIHRL